MAKGIGRDDWEGAWVPFLGLQGSLNNISDNS